MKIDQMIAMMKNGEHKQVYLLVLLLCGILLMLIPNTKENTVSEQAIISEQTAFSVETEERRLEAILSAIDGVGKCRVLLSVQNGAESILAENDGETVVLSSGGKQSTVTVQTRFPEFKGAVIVSGGCSSASVRYDILSSVMAYTGLGADKITICPIKE